MKMIAVLEVHDSTGWGDAQAAAHISDAVSYWTSSDVRSAIDGQENFVIINIANEPVGNNASANYVSDTIAAITALRNAGLTHNLMMINSRSQRGKRSARRQTGSLRRRRAAQAPRTRRAATLI